MRLPLTASLLLTLTLSAAAQEAPPPPTPEAVILARRVEKEAGRSPLTVARLNLKTGESTDFDEEVGKPGIIDLSPSRRQALVLTRRGVQVLHTANLMLAEDAPLGGRGLARFLSEDRVLLLEDVEDANTGKTNSRLVTVKLDGSERETIAQVPGELWDDVPLRVSPKGRWASFASLAEPRGVRLVDLKTGELIEIPDGMTFLAFSPDGSKLTLSKERLLVKDGQARSFVGHIKDGAFVKDEELAIGDAVIEWFDADTRALLRYGEGREFGVGSLVLKVGDVEVTLAEESVFKDGLLQLVDLDLDSGRIVWVDRPEARKFRVSTALLTKDGVKDKKELLTAPFLTAPFLVP